MKKKDFLKHNLGDKVQGPSWGRQERPKPLFSAVPKRGRSKCGRSQKHANERKRAQRSAKELKRANERKGAQKSAKGRKRRAQKIASAFKSQTTRFGNSQIDFWHLLSEGEKPPKIMPKKKFPGTKFLGTFWPSSH